MTSDELDALWLAAFKQSMSENSNTRHLFAQMVAARERDRILSLANSGGWVAVCDILGTDHEN